MAKTVPVELPASPPPGEAPKNYVVFNPFHIAIRGPEGNEVLKWKRGDRIDDDTFALIVQHGQAANVTRIKGG